MYYALQPFNTRLWLRHDIFFLWYPIPPSGELILPQLRILHCPRSLSSDNRSRKVEGWDVEENAGFIEFPTNLCSWRPNGDTEELKCTQEEDESIIYLRRIRRMRSEVVQFTWGKALKMILRGSSSSSSQHRICIKCPAILWVRK